MLKANHDPVVGIEELRRLRPMTDRPLVAIGGITVGNARSVLDAGADSVAVIGDLFPENGKIADGIREWLDLAGLLLFDVPIAFSDLGEGLFIAAFGFGGLRSPVFPA